MPQRFPSSLTGALVGLALLPAMLAAQSVMGRVVDSATHRPVAGLAVRLVTRLAGAGDSARDTVVASAQTAADGAFYLDAPRPGTYRVRLGEVQVGPPLTLASADAEDQHAYVLGAVPRSAASPYHILHGAALDSALATGSPLLACQVETPGGLQPATLLLRFPSELVDRVSVARVLAAYVVDTLGHLDPATLRFTRAPGTDAAFERAVADGLAKARFHPGAVDGRKVPQQAVTPVTFRTNTTRVPPASPDGPCGPLDPKDEVTVTVVHGVGRTRFQ